MGNPPLEKIRIAAPCNAEWRWMYGNDRVRFCSQCNLNVFNLSAMTTQEAEDLVRRTEGRLCARFYRRMDGTILTKNCPVGLQAIRDRFSRIRTGIIAATLSFLGHLGLIGAFRTVDRQLGSVTTGVLTYEMGDLGHWVSPDDANPNVPTMGKLVCPSR